ncbi:MAG TPA: hypothetical protein VH253_16555 [Phycisphaerae bacterium]|nr:hypothetical protein [Phycisphaerae bacterium]
MRALVVGSLALAGFAGSLTGCVGDITLHGDPYYERHYDRRVYVESPPPQPVYVAPAPGYAPPPPMYVPAPPGAAADVAPPPVVVEEAAPAPVYEVVPAPPGPGFLWVGGYWTHPGGRWSWVRGHYERPPRAGAVWVAPGWDHVGASFRFRAGGWR